MGWIWILRRCLSHASLVLALLGLGDCHSHSCLGTGLLGRWEIIVRRKRFGWL